MTRNAGPKYLRYAAAVVNCRQCQATRDALGGYVAEDHPEHANNSSPERRAAIRQADLALARATTEIDAARAAHLAAF